jgi:hypothetical protein
MIRGIEAGGKPRPYPAPPKDRRTLSKNACRDSKCPRGVPAIVAHRGEVSDWEGLLLPGGDTKLVKTDRCNNGHQILHCVEFHRVPMLSQSG